VILNQVKVTNPISKTSISTRSKGLLGGSAIVLLLVLMAVVFYPSVEYTIPNTSVQFTTNDSTLKKIFDKAEQLAFGNITFWGNRRVMIEGGQYKSIWLETQPMGGAMYAKRNLEIARNNIEIFIDYQREDGRLPGVIYNSSSGVPEPNYAQFQGCYLAGSAYELYFLLNQDTAYLRKVYNALEKFDRYLWRTRDSDHNGCLETWCIYDNGEDHSVRFNDFPKAWSFDFPPTKEIASKLTKAELQKHCKEDYYDSTKVMTVPIESMDVMSYSYSCCDVLSLISKELKNGQEMFWQSKRDSVKAKIKDYLWDANKRACYDRDKNNEVMPILLHNNLRCMYFGSFDQAMADSFIQTHLMNPKEFWTPMPLPSIAANDPAFQNISGNNWSGQPQGLTYQRSIQALENYGHYAELTLLGKKFFHSIADSIKFTQQFDPFTGKANSSENGYGPTLLTALEFISRFHGVHITQKKISWSCLSNQYDYTYTQHWSGIDYTLQTKGNDVTCLVDGKAKFVFSKGARVVTDLSGNIIEVVGISETINKIRLQNSNEHKLSVKPNTIYKLNASGKFVETRAIPFYTPK
jgi:hypothetical protein